MRKSELMSPREVCRELSVCNKTLNRWVERGWLTPVLRTFGGHGRFDRATVEAMKEIPRRDWPRVLSGQVSEQPAHFRSVSNARPYHLRHKPRGKITEALAANIGKARRRVKRATLDARELARLYDIAVWDLLGVERDALASQLQIRTLAVVAVALGVAVDDLREVCKMYDVPLSDELRSE